MIRNGITPARGFDGEDDDLSAKETLGMKHKEFKIYANSYNNEKNIAYKGPTSKDRIDTFQDSGLMCYSMCYFMC